MIQNMPHNTNLSTPTLHNIIQIQNNVLPNWQYDAEYSHIHTEHEEDST